MSETDENIRSTQQFEELPDAPPRRRLKFSWSGKLGICVVTLWMVLAVIGPHISPYHEADFLDEALFVVPGSGVQYPDTDFQGPSKVAWLGTDYLGRDTLSRILYGARTTLGISLAATLLAYLFGVTLGICAAVGGGMLDMGLSRFNDAFLSFPGGSCSSSSICFFQNQPVVPAINSLTLLAMLLSRASFPTSPSGNPLSLSVNGFRRFYRLI